jgi:hypothetical protein
MDEEKAMAGVAKEQQRAFLHFAAQHESLLQSFAAVSGASPGQKKARCGSGLNLSLEENRGDRFIMLHFKK